MRNAQRREQRQKHRPLPSPFLSAGSGLFCVYDLSDKANYELDRILGPVSRSRVYRDVI